jgi:hypothetical protein
MSPVERAYIKTLWRLLEDCAEHAEVSAVSADFVNVKPAAEAICDLRERFEQLEGTIDALLEAPPVSVFDLCAEMIPQQATGILGLKEKSQAVEWIKALQEECKRLINEESDDQTEPIATDRVV